MKSFITFLIMSLVVISFSGCSGGSSGDSASNTSTSSVSALSAREVAIDSTGNITLVHMSTPKKSFLDLFISAAYAALFVDIEPYFSSNMASVSIKDEYCVSFSGGVSCNNDGTLTETELKEQVTIFPLIGKDTNDDGNEDVSLVTLVEDKYYHLVVMRRGGGIPTQTLTSVSKDASCPLSITTYTTGGDIIIKTNNSITGIGGTGTNYIAAACKLSISGTFEGQSITKTFALTAFLDVGVLAGVDANSDGIDDAEDTTLYPDISELTFDNQSVTGNSVSINYQDFTTESDGYRYGEWRIVEGGTGTDIDRTFWLFSHGNGGLQKWLGITAPVGYYDTDTYSKCSGACPVGVIDPYGSVAGDPLYFPWQVGTSGEMLMLVSSIDSNRVMVQKKVAITAQ